MKKWIIFVLSFFMILALCACGSSESDKRHSGNDIYLGYTSGADTFIDMPNLRQYGGYTCGTTCVQMIMNWIAPYESDINLQTYEKELGTTEEYGTPPKNIVQYFKDCGIGYKEAENKTMEDLRAALDKGHPVMMCIQAWTIAEDGSFNVDNPSDSDTYLTDGHWVICVGYKKLDTEYQFYFNDPACVGYCIMSEGDLNSRWIDMDGEGTVYVHYGIEITEETEFDDEGVFYLK